MSEVKTPWKDYMGDVPMHLDYFQGSMFEAVERMAELYPNNIAFDFMGKSTTYKKMVQEIEKCAKSLKTLGVRPGDKVTIAMPNCPQAIYMFYAVNLVGGIANMIHPCRRKRKLSSTSMSPSLSPPSPWTSFTTSLSISARTPAS